MGFRRQEYWSELPFPSPAGDFLDLGMEPKSLALVGGFFTTEPPGKPYIHTHTHTHTHIYIYTHIYIHIYTYLIYMNHGQGTMAVGSTGSQRAGHD